MKKPPGGIMKRTSNKRVSKGMPLSISPTILTVFDAVGKIKRRLD